MAGLRELQTNFVDYFYLKSHPDDIPMKEKHLKESTQNPRKRMPNKWHKTKTTQEMFDSITASENISMPYKASNFYSMLSKYVHNDTLEIHKMNTPKIRIYISLFSRALYFSAMARYNPMLWIEHHKRYNKVPSICIDIDYRSRKTFM